MYTQEEKNLIVLSHFEELTYRARYCLLSELRSASPDFEKYRKILIKDGESGVYNKVRDKFYDESFRERILNGLERRNIRCVTYFSADYPSLLKEIPNPPLTLFCKGNTDLLKTRCFAVVGSRRTMPKMLTECSKFACELAGRFTIVTGLADGADSAAIEGALPSGKVISVLAYGFDHTYPAFNYKLMERVAESGLIISEYPPETPPKSYYFPVRNRIIAGLSEGTLVVSAAEKSGALITANFAAEFGRHLFALPYTIGITSGEGCNSLIKKGAFLAQNTLDIFSVFGLDLKTKSEVKLSESESRLLELIRQSGEAFVPSLAEKTGVPPFKLIPVLSSLEIKGLIVRLGGNRYSAV